MSLQLSLYDIPTNFNVKRVTKVIKINSMCLETVGLSVVIKKLHRTYNINKNVSNLSKVRKVVKSNDFMYFYKQIKHKNLKKVLKDKCSSFFVLAT